MLWQPGETNTMRKTRPLEPGIAELEKGVDSVYFCTQISRP